MHFTKQDFIKYNHNYVIDLYNNIINKKHICIGNKKSEYEVLIDENCDAVNFIKNNLNNIKQFYYLFCGKNPLYLFKTVDGQYIKFTQIYKGQFSLNNLRLSTEHQENISCQIFNILLNNNLYNIKINTVKIDESWKQSFKYQAKCFLNIIKKYNLSNDYKCYRKSKLISIINNKILQFNYKSKDSYIPADIWVYKNEEKIIPIINKCQSISQLTYVLNKLLKYKILIGISLKKLSKLGHCSLINFNKKFFDDSNISDIDIKYDLSIDTSSLIINFKFNNNYYCLTYNTSKCGEFEQNQLQLKRKNSSSRIGKVPQYIKNILLKKIFNTHTTDPKKILGLNIYKHLKIINKNNLYSQLKDQFKHEIQNNFAYLNSRFNSKLQSLELYSILKSNENKINIFLKLCYFSAYKCLNNPAYLLIDEQKI